MIIPLKSGVLCLIFLASSVFAIDPPAGLKPAKALGNSDQQIVPVPGQQKEQAPPNLSLRSRTIAALNSDPPPASNNKASEGTFQDGKNSEPSPLPVQPNGPVIFNKGNKNKKKQPQSQQPTVGSGSSNPVPVVNGNAISYKKFPHATVSPPEGKNYGVNTILQTNLVDSTGRVLKGVNSVPIRVPSADELRNAKNSRASASRVETGDENVAVKFGRAERSVLYRK